MRQASVLNTHAQVVGFEGTRILKVLTRQEAELGAYDPSSILLWREGNADGYAGAFHDDANEARVGPSISRPRDPTVVMPGDVIRVRGGSTQVSVLFRRGANANTLFATERCNSLCLMCSQPPRDEDDSWRIEECVAAVRLWDRGEAHIGVSGGEPTLLGPGLSKILLACRETLPQTAVHVLTNGRLFSDRPSAEDWVAAGGAETCWAVPLYGDVAEVHDEIVDAGGAFSETMLGLYELARVGAAVEIRIVLHAMSVPRLRELVSFIYRRLPFVRHVALMGLEPMGFAKRNKDRLWIDPVDYRDELRDAAHFLANRGMNVSIYNLSHCVLPRDLWPIARQSISDWKNRAAPECVGCDVTEKCSGFFASAGDAWRSREIAPIRLGEMIDEMA